MITLHGLGTKGIVKDIPSFIAPFNVWSDGKNVRFEDNAVVKGSGYTSVLTPTVAPYFLMDASSASSTFYIFASREKAYGWLGSSTAEITHAAGDYTGTETTPWNGGMFNGIPFLNNGVQAPQVWNPISLTQVLTDLTNWPASTTAKVVRAYRNFMVALNITKPAGTDPRMVKWSASADPGTIPTSWDETDATKDTGENVLSEGGDSLVDCRGLGPYNVIYGETSTWQMRYVGPPHIFAFDNRFRQSGSMTQDCVQSFLNRHFVLTQDDVVLHDLTNIESVIDDKMRRWLFSNINSTKLHLCRTVKHSFNREIWILFPYGPTSVLNMALIWNWRDGTWTIRELSDCACAMQIMYQESDAGTWDTLAAAWDTVTDPWKGDVISQEFLGTILLGSLNPSKVYLVNADGQNDGSNFISYVERTGLDVESAFDGTLYHDPTYTRYLTEVWPHIEGDPSTEFTIAVGHSDTPEGTVTWDDSATWQISDGPKCDLYASGRYMALRITHSGSEANWRLTGVGLELKRLGAF